MHSLCVETIDDIHSVGKWAHGDSNFTVCLFYKLQNRLGMTAYALDLISKTTGQGCKVYHSIPTESAGMFDAYWKKWNSR